MLLKQHHTPFERIGRLGAGRQAHEKKSRQHQGKHQHNNGALKADAGRSHRDLGAFQGILLVGGTFWSNQT
jgi:hypothetical protein